MKNRIPYGNLRIRGDIIEPIAHRIENESEFRQLLLKIYAIASAQSQFSFPDSSIYEIIQNLLPSELKNLNLTHDEIAHIVLQAETFDAKENSRPLKVFDEFLFGDPAESKYWVDKGKLMLDNCLLNNAIRCFNKAINIDPNRLDALYAKGWCLLKLSTIGLKLINNIWKDLTHFTDMTRNANSCFERIIEIDPQNALAWHGKGTCLLEISRYTTTKGIPNVRGTIDCFKRSFFYLLIQTIKMQKSSWEYFRPK